jgi:hypothetical protein
MTAQLSRLPAYVADLLPDPTENNAYSCWSAMCVRMRASWDEILYGVWRYLSTFRSDLLAHLLCGRKNEGPPKRWRSLTREAHPRIRNFNTQHREI